MADLELIPGVNLRLGRNEYVVPPAPFACVEKYEDVFMGRESNPSPAVMFDVLFMSVLRNYPDLSRDQLKNDVDVANMQDAFMSAMKTNASGSAPGET